MRQREHGGHALHNPNGARRVRTTCRLSLLAAALLVQLDAMAGDPAPTPAVAEAAAPADPQPVAFDIEMLQNRGVDAKVAEYFREAPRFHAGRQIVTLFVNGVRKGSVEALFDADGDLCIDRALLDQGGLVVPGERARIDRAQDETTAEPCYDYVQAFPQALIRLHPNRDEVELLVPGDALRTPGRNLSGFTRGGVAGLFNYDVLAMNNRFASGSSSTYRAISTEVGFNAGDWIFRSRQSYTDQDGRTNFDHLYAYGQKTFVEHASILQAGQLNLSNSIFPGDAITGVQIVPEAALRSDATGGAAVDGIAHSPARVEVRQNNALIYSTVVPAGPFRLENLPLLNGTLDLEVTVVEESGERRQFTVPAASLRNGASRTAPGHSFAAGRLRQFGEHGWGGGREEPWLVTTTGSWDFGHDLRATAGLMAASTYRGAGMALDWWFAPGTSLGYRQVASQSLREGIYGAQMSLSVSSAITPSLSTSLSSTWQTEDYRDLIDTTYELSSDWSRTRYRSQNTASLGWTSKRLGGFRTAYSRTTQFDGSGGHRITGSWGKTFEHATVSLNVEHSLGDSTRYSRDNGVYLSLSVPLDGRSFRTYVNHHDDGTRVGASINEQVNDYVGYRISAERDMEDRQTDLSARLDLLPRYAQVGLGYTRNGSGGTGYNGTLRGGVAVHRDGVTFSPYPIQDTFGIVSVGDLSGIKLSTPYGPVWTDIWGRAIAPQLPAYANSRIEVATKSLPRNVDIKNGFAEVGAGRGSVNHVDFGVVTTRRVLLNARMQDGRVLPKGASVVDVDDQFVTAVVDDGKIFLGNGALGKALLVNLPEDGQCELQYGLPDKADTQAYFESADAVCRSR
ncbi:fimbria/pilus outer membrane usher protein [Luteimonas sp. R10]|uniref:fimbria/pilus outer membrane usher protein n=1 Tax=Luteimonas sp. R10 TaxID=3108176 RepID=UPI00308C8B9D|nr:fimbria/pilus outer membrane usher protein [Luteimonas sp. R10]